MLENWDGQGLSDRRACLAASRLHIFSIGNLHLRFDFMQCVLFFGLQVILAEALLLNRVAALPTFTLAGQHNNGTSRASDLLEYLSLRHIPVQTVPLKSAGLS